MMRLLACLILALCTITIVVPDARSQGLLDRLLDKTAESAQRKAQDRVNQRIDQSIDEGINKSEDTVKCVATDPDCIKSAKEAGKKVEIVDEAELDVFRCSVSDADCLKRAKASGKKVEIID